MSQISARVARRLALTAAACAVACALHAGARASSDAGAGDSGAPPVPWCNDPSVLGPLRLYISGAEKAYVSYFGQQLAAGSTPITVIYQATGSCVGIDSILGVDPADTIMTGTASYTDAAGNSHNCTFKPPADAGAGAADSATVDIGVSDVFASSCGYATLPSDVEDAWGPISPAVFVTSPGSTQQGISAEIGYVAYGVNNGASTPWNDPAYLLTRGSGSGTQVLLAYAINVPANQWWGVNVGSTGNAAIATALSSATGAEVEKGLGALSTAYAAQYAAQTKVLAFQAQGQRAAFWPSSTPTGLDLQNVRDGHYVPWGIIHFFTTLSGGQPSALASTIISRITAAQTDQALIDLAAGQNAVPQCAMQVRRTSELGPLQPFKPTESCACYFVSKATGATPAECVACQGASDCPAARPNCNYGYCEVQ